ncbi:MAG TPA: hypothetical protein VMU01_06175 [Rhizomicrobium sp.]|nr:hypothetical protein [Rhizomicrobium sp.]
MSAATKQYRSRAVAALACLVVALSAAPAAAQQLVYRVDKATAVMHGRYLVVDVKGATKTGGWEHPRLVILRHTDAGNLELKLVATPPGNAAAVVQSVVPVNVSLKTRAPSRPVAAVKVVSQTNSVTTKIVAQNGRQNMALD